MPVIEPGHRGEPQPGAGVHRGDTGDTERGAAGQTAGRGEEEKGLVRERFTATYGRDYRRLLLAGPHVNRTYVREGITWPV